MFISFVTCQSMWSTLYQEHVNNPAIAWDCLACGCPNYSTFCFSMVFSTSNQFSVLSNDPLGFVLSIRFSNRCCFALADWKLTWSTRRCSSALLVLLDGLFCRRGVDAWIGGKLELVGHKAVYLSCYYNPKTNNEASIQEFGTSMERAARINNALISWDNFGSPEASWIVGDYEVQNIWSSSWFLNNLI
jgi:hypothetical protein